MPVGTRREVGRTAEGSARLRLDSERAASRVSQCLPDELGFGRSLGGGASRERDVDVGLDVDARLLHGPDLTTYPPPPVVGLDSWRETACSPIARVPVGR